MDKDPFEAWRKQREKEITRREFFDKALTATAAVGGPTLLGTVLGPLAWEWSQNKWSEEGLKDGIEKKRDHIRKRYDIEVGLSFKDFPEADTVQSSEIFSEEVKSLYIRYKAIEHMQSMLAVYPPGLLKLFLREIRVTDGIRLESLFEKHPDVAGTVDHERKLMLVGVQLIFQSHFAAMGRALPPITFHHEIAHLILKDIPEKDWTDLHPGVKYLWMFSRAIRENEVPPGFIRPHSLRSAAEDMATIAEVLLVNPQRIEDRGANDEIIRNKSNFVKKWYEQKSNGLMNTQYWEDLRAGRVNEAYWDKRGQAQ